MAMFVTPTSPRLNPIKQTACVEWRGGYFADFTRKVFRAEKPSNPT
jgi:hypothetical protein